MYGNCSIHVTKQRRWSAAQLLCKWAAFLFWYMQKPVFLMKPVCSIFEWCIGLQTIWATTLENTFLHMRKQERRYHCAADQRLYFHFIDSSIPVLPTCKSMDSQFQTYIYLLWCTARFVSDLLGNPEDRFSNIEVWHRLKFSHRPQCKLPHFVTLPAVTQHCTTKRSP